MDSWSCQVDFVRVLYRPWYDLRGWLGVKDQLPVYLCVLCCDWWWRKSIGDCVCVHVQVRGWHFFPSCILISTPTPTPTPTPHDSWASLLNASPVDLLSRWTQNLTSKRSVNLHSKLESIICVAFSSSPVTFKMGHGHWKWCERAKRSPDDSIGSTAVLPY